MTDIWDLDKTNLIINDLSTSLVVLVYYIIEEKGLNYTNRARDSLLRTLYSKKIDLSMRFHENE